MRQPGRREKGMHAVDWQEPAVTELKWQNPIALPPVAVQGVM